MLARDYESVVIVGAGQAAAQSVLSLRHWGYEGRITLIGEEPFPPYQRPPLSKDFLKGEFPEERLFFKPAPWYEDNGTDLVLATRAVSVDRTSKRVEIGHGGHVDYDALILATGARPRKLPLAGTDLRGVFDLRTLSDVERIRPRLYHGQKIVIVGGGYIGLEAAATAAQMGLTVTVLEREARVLARVTSPLISEFFEKLHDDKGVVIRTSSRLEEFEGRDGQLTHARLAGGVRMEADVALIGIGIVPNQELAEAAGLECDDGIVVDRDARTGDQDIFAIGDCARRPLVHYGRSMRLESVHNAVEQGKIAAAAIIGRERPVEDCPWFWSNQFDARLQIAGLQEGHDDIVLRGDPGSGKFAAFYFREDRLLAVDAVNSPAAYMTTRKIIASGGRPAKAALADPAVSMKEIAAATLR